MKKETLEKLITEGQRLAEKQSWLRKGFIDLIDGINTTLDSIDIEGGEPITYTILDKQGESMDDLDLHVVCKLHLSDHAYIELRKGLLHEYGWVYETIYPKDDYVETYIIRRFAEQLPYCFNHFLEVMKNRNEIDQQAVDTITEMLEKFK